MAQGCGEASGEGGDFARRVTEIAVLGEPVRRRLYLWVVAQEGSVTRDDVARGTAVAHHVAKFHLDKLVEEGLLDVEHRRPPGRGGPGAGRPAKHYRRSSHEVAVSLPERQYALAGRLLARAITEAERDGRAVDTVLREVAHESGASLGRAVRARAGTATDRSSLCDATNTVLAECGYEPRADETGVSLVNCPFHALAAEFTELVCGMNLELMRGLVDGLGTDRLGLEARLDPAPGRCCVRLCAR